MTEHNVLILGTAAATEPRHGPWMNGPTHDVQARVRLDAEQQSPPSSSQCTHAISPTLRAATLQSPCSLPHLSSVSHPVAMALTRSLITSSVSLPSSTHRELLLVLRLMSTWQRVQSHLKAKPGRKQAGPYLGFSKDKTASLKLKVRRRRADRICCA
jgi:hypothetical protein